MKAFQVNYIILIAGLLIILFVTITYSCAIKPKVDKMETLTLKETTVTTINNTQIGCGNIFIDDYILPDGIKKEGLIAELIFAEDNLRTTVGVGSEIEIEGKKYRVIKIEENSSGNQNGVVYIEEL